MPSNDEKQNRNAKNTAGRTQSFTVQDEIKRDRKLVRTRRRKRALSARRTLITIMLCVAIFVIAASAILFSVMRIDKVVVVGNSRYSVEEIIKASELQNAILPFAGERDAESKIIAACPYVDSVKFVKKYPSTIEVIVTEAEALYCINVEGRFFSLDSGLRVIDRVENPSGYVLLTLPMVKTAVEGSVIEFVDESQRTFINGVLEDLFKGDETLELTSLDVSNRFNIVAYIGDSVKIKFGEYDNIAAKIRCVKIILASSDVAMSKRTFIDVTYPEKAIVTPDYKGEF